MLLSKSTFSDNRRIAVIHSLGLYTVQEAAHEFALEMTRSALLVEPELPDLDSSLGTMYMDMYMDSLEEGDQIGTTCDVLASLLIHDNGRESSITAGCSLCSDTGETWTHGTVSIHFSDTNEPKWHFECRLTENGMEATKVNHR